MKKRNWPKSYTGRTLTVYIILRVIVIATMIMSFLSRNYQNVFMCVLTLILFYMPDILQRRLRIYLPDALEIIILVFIFAAEILGEIQSFYVKIPIWDTLLHTTTGFLAAAVGFSMVDLLNRNEQFSIRMSPIYMAVAAFCFSMTIGVMWEFFEFSMDVFFGMDTQKDTIVSGFSSVLLNPEPVNEAIKYRDITSTVVNGQDLGINGYLDIGLYDTMKDLLVNFIGAVVFSVIGFFYVKYRDRNSFVDKIIPKPEEGAK
ncbi:MAG: hypothetical protein IJ315_04360 [Firmicutes bacterium]|nr:hypothetical protein [Bacillota bacterium]